MLNIRPEAPADFAEIYELVKIAFAGAEHTNGDEQNLVNRLRHSPYYLPELALVAEQDGKLAGHIMFTKTKVGQLTCLVLAPLAVLPEFQGRGIGGALIREGHKRASELGYGYSFLVGHAGYYPRFGYIRASTLGVTCSLELPDENFMVCDLRHKDKAINAELSFAGEFFE